MDLDMIQDLLGGPNLPPPPSVQDLLGDVVPIARSPSPPPAPLASVRLSVEHNYSKPSMDSAAEAEEPMEHRASSPGSETLVPLNSSSDSYDSFLLNLLKVYTQNRIDTVATTSQSDPENSSIFTIDSISPEAVSALSQEQIQSLVTSNSLNYDVIQQILTYRQRAEGGNIGVDSSVGTTGEGMGLLGLATSGESRPMIQTSSERSENEAMSALQQLQALQLTPEQLKQIQLQMAELIRTKQIILPTELSVEQQHQLLQSLILKQVHTQHQQATTVPSTSNPPVSTSSTKATKSAGTQVTVGGTLAAMLSKDVVKQEGGGGGKAVKMEVPPPSNFSADTNSVALQLSPNPVTEDSPTAATSSTATVSQSVTTRSGGRKKKDAREQDEPKKPSQPYGIFFSDVYPTVLQANPKMSFAEASKIISMMWNAMGVDTKKQYYDRSGKQKEEYQAILESRKSETKPSETAVEVPATPQPQMEVHEVLATKQTVKVEVMTTQQEVGLADALSSGQAQKPPPAPVQARVLLKDIKHCVNDGCFKDAVYTEFRGPRYCSNECVVQHCRSVFQEWVSLRKVAT